ncbi:hypothetical protein HMPREF0880_03970 [Yokenella regensburgei ATCC 43003]|nr:hypothetical protein HMPREF0880_03970 [Yokenella regensburgei ATCC 43003]
MPGNEWLFVNRATNFRACSGLCGADGTRQMQYTPALIYPHHGANRIRVLRH